MDANREQAGSRALTIVLLVTVGVILLGYMLLPRITNGARSPKYRDCTNNLKQIGLYLRLYVEKYGGGTAYPPTNDP
ncbi:MAG: hypothetical protein RDV41_07590, partial [Planctomycetota bacterium]|nr:hypothetical protein [Planctomycetota bacterium]